jgi:hypothetical protein
VSRLLAQVHYMLVQVQNGIEFPHQVSGQLLLPQQETGTEVAGS